MYIDLSPCLSAQPDSYALIKKEMFVYVNELIQGSNDVQTKCDFKNLLIQTGYYDR